MNKQRKIQFLDKEYSKADLETMTLSDLANLRNIVSSNLGGNQIKKFRDKETGVIKTWEILEQYDAAEEGDLGALEAPKAAPKAKEEAPKVAAAANGSGKRRMRFMFVPDKTIRPLKNENSLRGRCQKLLKKGATFSDVKSLITMFDHERGKGNNETLERRAYELVRIMHYQLGYGINHNLQTDFIQLYSDIGDKK